MVSGELYLIVQNYKWVCMDSTLTRTLTPEILQGVPITYHTHLYHEDGAAFTAQDLADKYWYMTMYVTDAMGNTKCVLASNEYRVTGSDLYLQFTYMNTTELVEGFENDGDPQDTLTCSVQVDYDFSGNSSDSREIGQCLGFGRFKAKLIHRYECDGDSVNPVTPPGGGGTTDYNALRNKPSINGVTVEGDLTSEDLGITFTQEQANWDESDSTASSYILNKPAIPDAQVQVDWDESDSTSVKYILNKPTIPQPVPQEQADWDQSDSTAADYIENKPDLDVYMPKAGGTFTGDISVTGDIASSGNITSAGDTVSTVTATNNALAIPAKSGYVYLYTAVKNDEITFDTPATGDSPEFELDITQGATAVTFTLPTVTWSNGIAPQFDAASTTTRCKFKYVDGTWYGWVTPDMSEYALSSNVVPKAGGRFTGTIWASNVGIAFDPQNSVVQNNSLVIGFRPAAQGKYSLAMGYTAKTTQESELSLGYTGSSDHLPYSLVVCKGSNARDQIGLQTRAGDLYIAGDLTFTPAGASEATTLSTAIADLKAADVQADWDESDSSDLAYIQNKPSIPAPQVPADWDESDSTAPDYIKNKPSIPAPQVQANWDESDSTSPAYIENKPVVPQPVPQEQADWDQSDSTAVDYIKNKPDMSEYALKEDYVPKIGYQITGATGNLVITGSNNYKLLQLSPYSATLGLDARTSAQVGSIAIGYNCYAAQYDQVFGTQCYALDNTTNNALFGRGLRVTSSNHTVYGTWNADPAADIAVTLGCGTDGSNRDNAWSVKTDKTFVVHQNAVFDKNITAAGSVQSAGLPVVPLTTSKVPAVGAIYTYAPTEATTLVFPTPVPGKSNTFRLDITMGANEVTVSFVDPIVWDPALPTLKANTLTKIEFEWQDSDDSSTSESGPVGTWVGTIKPDMSEYMQRNILFTKAGVENKYFFRADPSGSFIVGDNTAASAGSVKFYGGTTDLIGLNVNIGWNATTVVKKGGYNPNTRNGFVILPGSGDLSLPTGLVLTGTLTSAGTEILTPSTTTITPQDNKVYQHTLADADVLTIDTSALTSTAQVQFELHLTQPSTAVTFTLPSGILWGDEYGDYDLSNPAPVISTPDTVYCLVFRWDGEVLMGNLTYTRAVVADESSSSGV